MPPRGVKTPVEGVGQVAGGAGTLASHHAAVKPSAGESGRDHAPYSRLAPKPTGAVGGMSAPGGIRHVR